MHGPYRSTGAAATGNSGFTLAEVIVALGLVSVLSIGLYATGIMVLRMTHFNRVSNAARLLAIQMVEEIAAESIPNIAMQVPYSPRTNILQHGERVIRWADVIGHTATRGLATNLASSAYVELHVNVAYQSPLTQAGVTNTFSTLMH